MIRFAALLLALMPSLAMAQNAITLDDTAGQTLYVRVYTSSSAAVAAALTAGTSGNTRLYYVTNSTLAGAGLSGTANYQYTIFSGTPSTSAADTAIATGMLRWNATVADDVAGKAAQTSILADTDELQAMWTTGGVMRLSQIATEAATETITNSLSSYFATRTLPAADYATASALSAKPTAAQIRSEMDSNSTKLANLDATMSSRATNAGAASAVAGSTPSAPFFTNAPEAIADLSPVTVVTDKLNTMLTSAGGGNSKFTQPALQEAPAGEGGGGLVIPVNQVAVPESRTWKLASTSDGLVGDFPKGLDLDEPEVFALNYAADLATNGRLVGIDSVRIVSVDGVAAEEDEAGLAWNLDDVDDAGVDKMLVKLRLTAVEAGLYQLEVKANRSAQDGGGLSKARVWIDASE